MEWKIGGEACWLILDTHCFKHQTYLFKKAKAINFISFLSVLHAVLTPKLLYFFFYCENGTCVDNF